MIALLAEVLLTILVAAAVVGWGLDAAVEGALAQAAAAGGDEVRTAASVRDLAVVAGWQYLGGIGALLLGRLWATRRKGTHIPLPLLVPSVALAAGIGLCVQWGYADPLHAAGAAFTAPGFAPGVLFGGILAGALCALPWSPADVVERWRGGIALLTLLLFVALGLFGEAPGASDARIRLFGVQPIEVAKVLFVAWLAAFLSSRASQLRWQRTAAGPLRLPRLGLLGPAVGLLAVLFVLLWALGDLGPTLILGLVFVVAYGVSTRSLPEVGLLVLAGGAALAVVLWGPAGLLPDMVQTRVGMWTDPWLNGHPYGDQVAHALWALASGGWSGQGLGRAWFGALQAGHTDLVLANLVEAGGVLGLGLYLLALFGFSLQTLFVAFRARTMERGLLALLLAVFVLAQWGIIAAGTARVLPLTGVVVPFLSFGKTSMVVFMAVVAVVVRTAVDGALPRDVPVLDEVRELRRATVGVGLGAVLLWVAAIWVVADVAVVRGMATSTRGVLTVGRDDAVFLRYDPRLRHLERQIRRGEVHDRNGVVLAGTDETGDRSYPLGPALGTLLGTPDRSIQTPNWAVEGLLDSTLRGLPPAEDQLSVWIEVRPDRVDDAGKDRVVLDRVLFTIDHEDFLAEDEARARRMAADGAAVRFTRVTTRDLRPLAQLQRMAPGPRAEALAQLAEDVPGRTVRLTLDARLQQAAYDALARIVPKASTVDAGAVVVLDVATGEVLARAQYPDVDLGKPAWKALARSGDARFQGSYGPWRDKTGIGGLYQAGSVFKLATAMAWTRSGVETEGGRCSTATAQTWSCKETDGRPYYTRPDWTEAVHDHGRTPHGDLDLAEALEVSCNVFFAQLGLELGPEPFAELVAAGLEVDMAGPDAGVGFDAGKPGSRHLASTAFGQGAARMHPLQAARMVAAVGAGGVYRKCPPDMVLGAECVSRQVAPADALQPVLAGMAGVIDEGTARRFARLDGVRVYGKTGTATDAGREDERVYGIRRRSEQPPHSWFVALAEPGPRKDSGGAEDPCEPTAAGRLAVAAVVPRGGAGSGAALDVTREVISAANDLGYFGATQAAP